jgi:hypothetical protein
LCFATSPPLIRVSSLAYQRLNDFDWHAPCPWQIAGERVAEQLPIRRASPQATYHTETSMGTNPFAAVAEFWSPLAMKVHIILMIAAVIFGTLFDVSHKGSGIYFAQRREKSKARAR